MSLIRVGAFSGSGLSLRTALQTRVDLVDFDLISLARRPSLWPSRMLAMAESMLSGGSVPYSKTAAWSRGLQRALPPSLLERPTLFVQTTAAPDLPEPVRYSIYTDRLGREGMASAEFPSLATPGWVAREQRFVERADRLFVMGPSTKACAITEYGIVPEKVLVVGGAPNAQLGPHRQSGRCQQLLFVGIDWERKGLPDLLNAFDVVQKEHPSVALDVIGGHPELPASSGVRYLGRVPHEQMSEHFARADLLVIPTHAEPFGIALVEALMMGIPVIGTNVGNQEWIIGGGGITVQPARPDELANAIRRAIDDYPTLKSNADKRREELLATMTWDRIAQRIIAGFLGEEERTS